MKTIEPIKFVKPTRSYKIQDAVLRGSKFLYSEKFLERIKKDPNFFKALVFGLYFMNISVKSIVNATGSWYNVGLPREERKFATAADLFDGVTKIVVSFPLYIVLSNNFAKLHKKLFKGIEKFPDRLAYAKNGFSALLGIGLYSVFLNSIVSSFISTPLAMHFKQKYFDKSLRKQNIK